MRSTLLTATAALALLTSGCAWTIASVEGTAPDPVVRHEQAPVTESAPATPVPGFGFVHAVDASTFPVRVTLDAAEWFAGEAARRAFAEDHPELVGTDGDLTGDVYVRNGAPELSTVTAVGNIVITVVDPDGTEHVLTPEEWQARITAQASGEGAFFEPYHLTFVGDELVEVRAQPLP